MVKTFFAISGMLCLALWTESTYSQSVSDEPVYPPLRGVVWSFAVPTGDFASESIKDSGPASHGVGGGLLMYTPVGNSTVFLMGLEARFTYNRVDFSDLEAEYGPNAEFRDESYRNIWLMGGLAYSLSDQIGIRGLAGLVIAGPPGIDFRSEKNVFFRNADPDYTIGIGLGATYRFNRSFFADMTLLSCKPGYKIITDKAVEPVYNRFYDTLVRQESLLAVSLGWSF